MGFYTYNLNIILFENNFESPTLQATIYKYLMRVLHSYFIRNNKTYWE